MVSYRTAGVEDAQGIAVVQVAAWQQRLSAWAPDWFVARFKVGEQASKYAERAADPNYIIVVAEEDDDIIGFAAMKPNTSAPLEYSHQIGALYVAPDHEGRGVGTSLMEFLLAIAAEQKVRNAVLWTFRDNTPARKLYEKCGGVLLPYTEAADMDLDIPHISYGWTLS